MNLAALGMPCRHHIATMIVMCMHDVAPLYAAPPSCSTVGREGFEVIGRNLCDKRVMMAYAALAWNVRGVHGG